jgi:hypothetical protein
VVFNQGTTLGRNIAKNLNSNFKFVSSKYNALKDDFEVVLSSLDPKFEATQQGIVKQIDNFESKRG